MVTRRARSDQAKASAQAGAGAEDRALVFLQQQGLRLIERNYRVARGPAQHGGEIDLVLRDNDGTLVFVEVRARHSAHQGGAAASVGAVKQRRVIYAAQHFLLRYASLPRCRFDVVAVDAGHIDWLPAAFAAV